MPTDLDILKKAFHSATATSSATKAWDEPLSRRDTVHPEQVFPAPSLPLEVGGWVASLGTPYTTVAYFGSATNPVPVAGALPARTHLETSPGRAGFNDVDYVPYNWGTNRFGGKGGALLGHPISWEVVGPTGKSPHTHWQWAVDTGTNTLTLEEGVLSQLFTTIPPHVAPATVPTVAQAYGLTTMPNGGMYALVELTGNEASNLLLAPANPLVPINEETSRFEVFRVASWAGQDLVLVSTKPLTDYFTTVGVNDKIKSITLIRPKVTRLVALPLSLNGTTQRNQVFVFMPPERAANSEYMPPYNGSGVCPDWSVNGVFDTAGSIPTGEPAYYGTPNLLPVPQPLERGLSGTYAVGAVGTANLWRVQVTYSGTFTPGQIIRVHTVERDAITDDQVSQALGWFEIESVVPGAPQDLTLRRVPEVNSVTGAVFYGNGPVGVVTDKIVVDLYDNIGTIFTDPVLNIPKVSSARLDHLIDPKVLDTSFRSGLSSNPPGPAVFDTVSGNNPGNLTDLGFRVVLFPAKDSGGVVVPDFDFPVLGNTVVLDPSISPTGQFIEVDYAAGVLYLSHPPVPGADCVVAPNGIIADPVNNPRNEVVLYAACVPYSREESQRGPSVQVKTTRVGGSFGSNDAVDVYGQRLVCTPDATTYGALGTELLLSAPAVNPPPSGWFQLGELDTGENPSFVSMGGPNYYGWYDPITTTLYGIGEEAPYTITEFTRVMFLKSPPFPKASYDSDGVRGSAKRTPVLNFRGTRTTIGPDGSVLISPVATLDDAYRGNDSETPGIGRFIGVDGGAVEAQPIYSSGADIFNASFRVNTEFTTPGNLVGFDFLGWDPGGGRDSYAGFIDRRVFTAATATTTITSDFDCDVAAGVVSIDPLGANNFWEPTGYKKTLLTFFLDLIQIDTVTYVISGFSGATGHAITILNLDGTVPTVSFGSGLYNGVKATIYRPKFFTSRGDTGTPALNLNTWFAAQARSETLLAEPIGALNLYGGSATAISPGDGGGSTSALSFWARFNILGSEVVLSPTYHDTFGRLVSILNPVFMTGGSLPDYVFRGDFLTRAVKDSLLPAVPTFGHIVEDYTYNSFRYDYLSLMELVGGSPVYVGTATANIATQGEMSVALAYSLIPYGAAIAEVVSVNGDTTRKGLYLVYATDGAANLYIRAMDDSLPTAFVAADSISFRLHYYEAPGRHVNGKYLSTGSSPSTHTSTHTIGMSLEADAVGLVIAGPNRTTGGADRHAYRVTMAGTGGSVTPSNHEKAALDIEGYHKASDYLYNLPLQAITKQLNPVTFTGLDSFGTAQWAFDSSLGSTWFALAWTTLLRIPLELPRSSERLNSGGSRTHRTCLQYITIMGKFIAGGALANVSVHKVRCSPGTPPTRADTLLYVNQPPLVFPCSTSTDLAASGVGGDTYYVSVYEDNMGTLPVYIDDTDDYTYYIVIQANNGGASLDEVYGVQVTYTDPGPRNY